MPLRQFLPVTVPICGGACRKMKRIRYSLSGRQPVNPQNGQEICPQVTTVYTLRIVYPDGTQESYQQAVIIDPIKQPGLRVC